MENPGDIYSNSRETKAESSSKLQNLKALSELPANLMDSVSNYQGWMNDPPNYGIQNGIKSASDDYAKFLYDLGTYYRPNRFYATVFPPTTTGMRISDIYNNDGSGLRFSCEAADIPDQTLSTIDYRLNILPTVKIPYMVNYGTNEITLTFRMSGTEKYSYKERRLFLNWQEQIFSFTDKSTGARYLNEFTNTSMIVLSQIDTANKKIYNTKFTNVYPISVGGIQHSWGTQDDYVRQTVTFAFTQMLSEGVEERKIENTIVGVDFTAKLPSAARQLPSILSNPLKGTVLPGNSSDRDTLEQILGLGELA